MNNLDLLMSPYTDGAPFGTAAIDALEPRHRADGPAEMGGEAWAQAFRPRHRADCLTGS